MVSITKEFGPYPFAHRQPKHDGHCRLIHGHNWVFAISFAAEVLDANSFVADFGKMGYLKSLLEDYFDHTLVLNADDPELNNLVESLHNRGLAKIVTVPNCGAEAIANLVHDLARDWIHLVEEYGSRGLRVVSVTVFEDEKNSATYTP